MDGWPPPLPVGPSLCPTGWPRLPRSAPLRAATTQPRDAAAAARVRAMTGFSFNKAVFKPFMYKFSDHLSGKSAQLPSVAVQCPVAGIHSSSDNIIDYRWWVGGRLGGWNLVCQKQKRISLTTHRSVPNTHWGQRVLQFHEFCEGHRNYSQSNLKIHGFLVISSGI